MAVSAAPPYVQPVSHRVADQSDPPRQMSGLAWGAIVCLGISSLLYVGRIVAAFGLHSAAGGEGDVSGAHHTYGIWLGLGGLAALVSAVVFMAWFNRGYRNLRRLGVQSMRYGLGWAIGAWFIPIFSFFRPKQIANDVWRGSERGVEVSAGWRSVEVAPLVHWWWGLFLAQGTLIWVGQQLTSTGYGKLTSFGGSIGSGLSQIRTGTTIEILGAILGIAAAIVAIMVVSQLSERLDLARQDALAAGPLAPSPPAAMMPPPTSFPPPPPGSLQASAPSPGAVAPAAPPPAAPPAEQRVRCPQCAEWILPQAKVCRFCGHRLEQLG